MSRTFTLLDRQTGAPVATADRLEALEQGARRQFGAHWRARYMVRDQVALTTATGAALLSVLS